MATKTAIPLINLLPPITKGCRAWRGEFVTSAGSATQGVLVCEGLRDRGYAHSRELAHHWVYMLDDGIARRVLGYTPDSDQLRVSAGSTFTPAEGERFWVMNESPHSFIEALGQMLAENPRLYTLDQDFILSITDNDELEISDQSQRLSDFSNWDLENPTRGSWRRFLNHVEIWMAGVSQVLEVRVGAPIQGSTFDGYDETQAFDHLLPFDYWSWDAAASQLRLPDAIWGQTVLIAAEMEALRADELLGLTLENAQNLNIGGARTDQSVYGSGLASNQIAALVNLAIAKWLSNQQSKLTGEQNLETKRLETHLRNRAQELIPVPAPVFKT